MLSNTCSCKTEKDKDFKELSADVSKKKSFFSMTVCDFGHDLSVALFLYIFFLFSFSFFSLSASLFHHKNYQSLRVKSRLE